MNGDRAAWRESCDENEKEERMDESKWSRILTSSYRWDKRRLRLEWKRNHVAGTPATSVDLSPWWNVQSEWRDKTIRIFRQYWEEFVLKNATITTHLLSECVLTERISKLDLEGCAMLGDEAARLIGSSCFQLQHINLSRCALLTDHGVTCIAAGCSKLRSVRLDRCFSVTDEGFSICLLKCTELEEISFQGNSNLRGGGFLSLPNAKNSTVMLILHRKVKYVNFGECCNLTDDSIRWISESLASLTSLNLSGCKLLTNTAVVNLLPLAGSLAELNISSCPKVTHKIVKTLFTFQKLRSISVDGLGPNSLKALLSECSLLESIETKSLTHSDQKRTRPNAEVLNLQLAIIQSLKLQGCEYITDAYLDLNLRKARNLVSLDLSYCKNISGPGLASTLASCSRSLKTLDLSYCSGLQPVQNWCRPGLLQLERVGISGLCFFHDENLKYLVSEEHTEWLDICDNENIQFLHACCSGLTILNAQIGCPRLDWIKVAVTCPSLRRDARLTSKTSFLQRLELEEKSCVSIQRQFRKFQCAKWNSFRYMLIRHRKSTDLAATKFQAVWRQYRILSPKELARRFSVLQKEFRIQRWFKNFPQNILNFKRLWKASIKIQSLARGFLWRKSHLQEMEHIDRCRYKYMFRPVLPEFMAEKQFHDTFLRAFMDAYLVPDMLNRKDPVTEINIVLRPYKDIIALKSKVLMELQEVIQFREAKRVADEIERLKLRSALFGVSATVIQKQVRSFLVKTKLQAEKAVKTRRIEKLQSKFPELTLMTLMNERVEASLCKAQGLVRGHLQRWEPERFLECVEKSVPYFVQLIKSNFEEQEKSLDNPALFRRELEKLRVWEQHFGSPTCAFEAAKFEFFAMMAASMQLRVASSEHFNTNFIRRRLYHIETAKLAQEDCKDMKTLWKVSEGLKIALEKRRDDLENGKHNYRKSIDPNLRAVAKMSQSIREKTVKIELEWIQDCLSKRVEPLMQQAKRAFHNTVHGESRRLRDELTRQEVILDTYLKIRQLSQQEWCLRKEVLSNRIHIVNILDEEKQVRILHQVEQLKAKLQIVHKKATQTSHDFIDLCIRPRIKSVPIKREFKGRLRKEIKRAQREFNYQAWSAMLPVDFFKPEHSKRLDAAIQAARNRVVNVDLERNHIEHLNLEERLRLEMENLMIKNMKNEKGGLTLMQQVILDAKLEELEGKPSIVRRMKSLVQSTLTRALGTEERVEKERIIKAILSRQKEAIGVTEGIEDVCITVGREEREQMESTAGTGLESQEGGRKSLSGFSRFQRIEYDLSVAFGVSESVFFWVKPTTSPMKQFRTLRIVSGGTNVPEFIDHTTIENQAMDEDKSGAILDKVEHAFRKQTNFLHKTNGVSRIEADEKVVTHPALHGFRLHLSRKGRPEDTILQLKFTHKGPQEDVLARKGYERVQVPLMDAHGTRIVANDIFLWVLRKEKADGIRLDSLESLLSTKEQFEKMIEENPQNEKARDLLNEVLLDIEEHNARNSALDTQDRFEKTIDFLGLTKKDLKKLTACFAAMDTEQEGQVGLEQFFYYIGLKENLVTSRVFKFLDTSGDGTMDFGELVYSMSTFCLLGSREVVQLVFQLVDPDGKGQIGIQTFHDLLRDAHDIDPEDHRDLKRVKEFVEANYSGSLSFDDLYALNARYPMILLPVMEMQLAMMKAFLGKSWWDRKKSLFARAREELKARNEKEKDQLQRQELKQERLLARTTGSPANY